MKKRRKKREDEHRKKKKKKQSFLEILFILKLKQLKGLLFSDFFDILWSSLTDPEPIENFTKPLRPGTVTKPPRKAIRRSKRSSEANFEFHSMIRIT